MRHQSDGQGEFEGGLAAHALASAYLHLLEHGAVSGPYELWDFTPGEPTYRHWCRFFDEQVALDGLRVRHETHVETSWGNARVVLARPDGDPYDLPLHVETSGWGTQHPSSFSSKGQRIYQRMERELESERRRAREADWGDTLAAARRRAEAAEASAHERAGVPRPPRPRPAVEAVKSAVAPVTEFVANLRRAIANPGFEFNGFILDPHEPYRPAPHADGCDGTCEAIIPDVVYSCRRPADSEPQP